MAVAIIRIGERTVPVDVDSDSRARIGDQTFAIESLGGGWYRVESDGHSWIVAVAGPSDDRWIAVAGQTARLEIADRADDGARRRRAAGHELTAPMPATVIRVLATPGAHVAAGDVLLMLEAMKMELAVRAPRDGVVRAIHCQAGDLVQPDVALLDLE